MGKLTVLNGNYFDCRFSNITTRAGASQIFIRNHQPPNPLLKTSFPLEPSLVIKESQNPQEEETLSDEEAIKNFAHELRMDPGFASKVSPDNLEGQRILKLAQASLEAEANQLELRLLGLDEGLATILKRLK